ncbi:hypothetical protein [Candidatus Poriferisodalis sp.]|uniref:hypothetical protein n=1 Tax=Candidatus Poriferisodalis sp. TaxID=3101277 RepID=UPI003D0B07D8
MLTRHDVLRFSCLVFRILYRFLAALAGLAVRSGRSNDLEIIVLRHQLTVLRRQDNRPQLNHNDRTLLGAIAAAVRRLVIDMATDNPTWRYRPTAPLLPAVVHRHHKPRGLLRRHHHQPNRRLDHPSSPQPVPAPQRTTRRCPSTRR